MNSTAWVLGTELWTFARASSAPNGWAISWVLRDRCLIPIGAYTAFLNIKIKFLKVKVRESWHIFVTSSQRRNMQTYFIWKGVRGRAYHQGIVYGDNLSSPKSSWVVESSFCQTRPISQPLPVQMYFINQGLACFWLMSGKYESGQQTKSVTSLNGFFVLYIPNSFCFHWLVFKKNNQCILDACWIYRKSTLGIMGDNLGDSYFL